MDEMKISIEKMLYYLKLLIIRAKKNFVFVQNQGCIQKCFS